MVQKTESFTLALKSSADIEGFPCEEIYTIKRDGVPLLDLYFGFAVDSITGNEYAVSARIESVYSHCHFMPEELPFIYNGFQLIGIINQLIADNMGENEFTSGAFYADDECATERELPIDFGVLTN